MERAFFIYFCASSMNPDLKKFSHFPVDCLSLCRMTKRATLKYSTFLLHLQVQKPNSIIVRLRNSGLNY